MCNLATADVILASISYKSNSVADFYARPYKLCVSRKHEGRNGQNACRYTHLCSSCFVRRSLTCETIHTRPVQGPADEVVAGNEPIIFSLLFGAIDRRKHRPVYRRRFFLSIGLCASRSTHGQSGLVHEIFVVMTLMTSASSFRARIGLLLRWKSFFVSGIL